MKKGQVFRKVHDAFWTSGLFGALQPQELKALLALASYVNEEGKCWPTMEQLAERMGVSRPTANKWVGDLLEFRWHDKPIVTVGKHDNGSWGNNVYRLSDWCQITIFDKKPSRIEPGGAPMRSTRGNAENLAAYREAKKRRQGEDSV